MSSFIQGASPLPGTPSSAGTSYCFPSTEKSPSRRPPTDPRPQQSGHAPAHLAGRSLHARLPPTCDARNAPPPGPRGPAPDPRAAPRLPAPARGPARLRAPHPAPRTPHPSRDRRWLHRGWEEAPGRSPPQAGRPNAAGVTRATGPKKAGSAPATPRAPGLPLPACLGRARTTFPRRRLGDPREMPIPCPRELTGPAARPREVRGNARARASPVRRVVSGQGPLPASVRGLAGLGRQGDLGKTKPEFRRL